MIHKLIKIANQLDAKGHYQLASQVDAILQLAAEEKYKYYGYKTPEEYKEYHKELDPYWEKKKQEETTLGPAKKTKEQVFRVGDEITFLTSGNVTVEGKIIDLSSSRNGDYAYRIKYSDPDSSGWNTEQWFTQEYLLNAVIHIKEKPKLTKFLNMLKSKLEFKSSVFIGIGRNFDGASIIYSFPDSAGAAQFVRRYIPKNVYIEDEGFGKITIMAQQTRSKVMVIVSAFPEYLAQELKDFVRELFQ